MKTVFVTGAEGFTGARLVERLLSQRFEVIGGVRNRARKLAFEKNHGRAIVCDVSDAINVARAIASAKPTAIIHLAGASQPGMAENEPLEAYQSIVSAWANVLDGARRSAPRARVVLASACDVYGDAGADGHPLTEDTPCAPVTTFGALKAAAETIAQTFHRNFHTNVVIARPFHYLGAGQSDGFYFGRIARRIADWDVTTDGSTLCLTDLDCRRDLLHVDDVVSAYEAMLEGGQPNCVYNICSGAATTVRDVVQRMISACGRNITLTPDNQPENTDDSPSIACYLGCNTRITNELSWRPSRTLDQAIESLVTSCMNQRAAAMSRG